VHVSALVLIDDFVHVVVFGVFAFLFFVVPEVALAHLGEQTRVDQRRGPLLDLVEVLVECINYLAHRLLAAVGDDGVELRADHLAPPVLDFLLLVARVLEVLEQVQVQLEAVVGHQEQDVELVDVLAHLAQLLEDDQRGLFGVIEVHHRGLRLAAHDFQQVVFVDQFDELGLLEEEQFATLLTVDVADGGRELDALRKAEEFPLAHEVLVAAGEQHLLLEQVLLVGALAGVDQLEPLHGFVFGHHGFGVRKAQQLHVFEHAHEDLQTDVVEHLDLLAQVVLDVPLHLVFLLFGQLLDQVLLFLQNDVAAFGDQQVQVEATFAVELLLAPDVLHAVLGLQTALVQHVVFDCVECDAGQEVTEDVDADQHADHAEHALEGVGGGHVALPHGGDRLDGPVPGRNLEVVVQDAVGGVAVLAFGGVAGAEHHAPPVVFVQLLLLERVVLLVLAYAAAVGVLDTVHGLLGEVEVVVGLADPEHPDHEAAHEVAGADEQHGAFEQLQDLVEELALLALHVLLDLRVLDHLKDLGHARDLEQAQHLQLLHLGEPTETAALGERGAGEGGDDDVEGDAAEEVDEEPGVDLLVRDAREVVDHDVVVVDLGRVEVNEDVHDEELVHALVDVPEHGVVVFEFLLRQRDRQHQGQLGQRKQNQDVPEVREQVVRIQNKFPAFDYLDRSFGVIFLLLEEVSHFLTLEFLLEVLGLDVNIRKLVDLETLLGVLVGKAHLLNLVAALLEEVVGSE